MIRDHIHKFVDSSGSSARYVIESDTHWIVVNPHCSSIFFRLNVMTGKILLDERTSLKLFLKKVVYKPEDLIALNRWSTSVPSPLEQLEDDVLLIVIDRLLSTAAVRGLPTSESEVDSDSIYAATNYQDP